MSTVFIVPLIVFPIIVFLNFVSFVDNGQLKTNIAWTRIIDFWTILVLPVFFIVEFDFGKINDCCSDSAFFAPGHRYSLYVIILICIAAYFYSAYRRAIATPVVEILVNCFLTLGILLNVLILIQLTTEDLDALIWSIGVIPIITLFILKLYQNQLLLTQYIETGNFKTGNFFINIALKILSLKPLIKFPVLFVLALPILLIISLLLLLFGQKPDSFIRAFTDTYKHGFSQLDYMCDNVECGSHYLCSVAANGHKNIVQPQRLGKRNENNIVCNRQLLVSNAFEELIQEQLPLIHKIIRQQYNKVGKFIHRYYFLFNNKFIADSIYILMKPLEWLFLFTLYTFDRNPEDRIAKQYLSNNDRKKINRHCNFKKSSKVFSIN